jgi:hypothetical protein
VKGGSGGPRTLRGNDRDRPSDRGGVRVPRRRRERPEVQPEGARDPQDHRGAARGVGTVYASTVKDAGVKTQREFRLTEFEPPTKIRWSETSKNAVTAPEGGYDLQPAGEGTELTVYNVLEGHGFGKLIAGFALRSARKGADDFARSIKAAVEAS